MKTEGQKRPSRAVATGIVIILALLVLHFFAGMGLASGKGETGRFNLVSVGVGDPDLITVRAIETIKESDIIICRPRLRETFASYLEGKTFWDGAFGEWRTYGRDCDSLEDEEARAKCISDKKVRNQVEADIRKAVKAGKTVSVLGQGDLLIYGGPYRWYMKELADIGVNIIPGISALNAANAALGKDIMGGKNTSSAVMTIYRDIDKVAVHQPTLVIFTMFTVFSDLVEKLKQYYPEETPIAVVFYAGYKEKEYIISGTLDTILAKTDGIDWPFEHLVYVGDFME